LDCLRECCVSRERESKRKCSSYLLQAREHVLRKYLYSFKINAKPSEKPTFITNSKLDSNKSLVNKDEREKKRERERERALLVLKTTSLELYAHVEISS